MQNIEGQLSIFDYVKQEYPIRDPNAMPGRKIPTGNTFSQAVKQSIHGDEYYTPQNAVDMIIPYILRGGYRTVWCPFDKADSKFVTTLERKGFTVNYGHIETGQDFFDYRIPQGEIIVSNPPFSKRDRIFERLYEWDIPFALILNFNGLFDSKKRADIFRKHRIEILVPRGRMKFYHRDMGYLNSPNFQSVYVCNHLLDNQIVFDETSF